MDTLVLVISLVLAVIILFLVFEYRIRQADTLALYETQGRIGVRKAPFYPRHFSLALKRTTLPLQMTIEATAAGNLGVRVQLAGALAPALNHLDALLRVGGWNSDAVVRAADQVQILLQGLVKEYCEQHEINALASRGLLSYLNERAGQTREKFGVEIVSLAVQTLDPADEEIAEALRQQEQARLLEQTERLNQQARVSAAKARFQAEEEIAAMEHALELKKAELNRQRLEIESALNQQRLEDELESSRKRLAFEREELELLKGSPELLMLTPQAARLAEASQNLKNARTIISLTPEELAHGSELLEMFQNLLKKGLEEKNKP